MRELIDKLPMDIILHIIPYTYNFQKKDLLNDIKSYSEAKTLLSNNYYNYWIIFVQSQEPQDKYWLINDIFAYANNYNATMYGYVDEFYNIFKQNPFLQSNQDIDRYILNLEKKDVTSQINVFLGMLTPDQRNDIICNCSHYSIL
uniref:Uncharacterized protein n=1 Tax=viral metagenome TaxID=1070528 RepID=A0A6C0JGR1_9ZZZZ